MEDAVPVEAAQPAAALAEQLPLESGVGFRLSRLARSLRAQWAQELTVVGLTPPQAALLRAIAVRPGLSLRALARTLGTEPMRAKRCADDLEAAGLLRSAHRGDDRRPRQLSLSPKGLELAGRVDLLVRRQEARIERVLGQDLRPGLENALTTLERSLGVGTPGGAPASGNVAARAGGETTGGRGDQPLGRTDKAPTGGDAL